jgi:tetratricopeptide (TPR) repeat protein
MEVILTILNALASLLTILGFMRRREEVLSSPFEILNIGELPQRLSSPLKSLPPRIGRDPPLRYDIPFQVIYGTSGVGKTRTAIDIASTLANTVQAATVYLARGYVDAAARLPDKGPRRKVIVLIDDYDYGYINTASSLFEERQAAYSGALENLSELYRAVDSKVEICGFIVTINSNRLPLVQKDVKRVLPAFEFRKLHPVSVTEHKEFLKSLASMLEISFDVNATGIIEKAGDGRFDTVAIFLSSIPKGTIVEKQKAEEYLQVQKSVWEIFRQHLSAQQLYVYNCIKILRDFGVPARTEYIYQMVKGQFLREMNTSQIRNVLTSLWDVYEDQAMVYDGQFEPAYPNKDSAETVVKACISAGRVLRKKKRYFFQLEMKTLIDTLINMSLDKLATRLLRKLNGWYPRDRYFAYLLADAYAKRGRYLRAMWHLYRIFRRPDVMAVYSGKWIEIRAHLLLARIYKSMGMYKLRHDWNWHKRIEHEFNMAASLADLDIPDTGLNGFEYVGSSGKEISPESDPKKPLEEHLHELGYNVPEGKSLNTKHLRAIVHHSYSVYLLSQFHQEHRAIHHELIVTQILPDYGEAYLNCAKACLQLGDSQRAVTFLSQAASASPQYLNQATYSFMVSSYRYQAYADLGQIEMARKYFAECQKLTLYEPLSADEKLKAGLAQIEKDRNYWDRHARLASLREKRFADALVYHLLYEDIEIVLPSDWKVGGENCSNRGQDDWLLAGFASPLTWDTKTKTPADATVMLHYTMEREHILKDARAYGLWYLERQAAAAKKMKTRYSWELEMGPLNLGNAICYQWFFKIHNQWPKTGRVMAFALPQARVLLHLMWEDCGSATFSPIMESIGTAFRNQEVFRGLLH